MNGPAIVIGIMLALPALSAKGQAGAKVTGGQADSTGSVHINGTITGSRGEIIESATVRIRELNKGVITDVNGYFELKNLPPGTWLLRVSFTGYEPYQATVPVREGVVTHNVLLSPAGSLDEMVVTGTMKTIRRSD
ncbi:MAG TPA: carboxypeptidase-like regulatory domain-containing protein, partial [Cyclobacteriaceae bacterium]|nr:carboxypeptidase-like regulatory domain-containing protein [Cyclobacteriaceae bacterium]